MSHPHSPLSRRPQADPPLPCEPALTQLRDLEPPALDTLVLRWLDAIGLTGARVRQHQPGTATYQAILGRPPLAVPLQIRVHQRTNRLQVHHIDAFRGYLQRQGIPGGLLITTGGCSRDAGLIAGSTQAPHVCLLSGEQWCALLAAERAGVRPARLLRWIVDLRNILSPRGRSAPPSAEDQ